MDLKFYELNKTFNRKNFDCGIIELNTFIREEARQQQSKHLNKTFVLVDENGADPLRILAFYSISMCEIALTSISDSIKKKLPKYPIPAARIGRLAVDKNFKQQGFGKITLVDALIRIRRVSVDIGVYAVTVDAINDQAKSFYKHFGFIEFKDQTNSLFMPIGSVPIR